MTAWFYGQAPARRGGGDPRIPFVGDRHGRKLALLAGVDTSELEGLFEFRNVLDEYPGRNGHGDLFPMKLARPAAAKLAHEWQPGDVALFAGWQVAHAFGGRAATYFRWFRVRGIRAAVFPHPSGVNHFWNEPANVAEAASFLRDVVKELQR